MTANPIRSFRPIALLSAVCFLTPFPVRGERAAPNVILISADDMRADRLGCYNGASSATPNLDRLAREGVLFENAYSHATETLASHMSLFTSLDPLTHQVLNVSYAVDANRLPATLAEAFQAAGYRTAAFGLKDKVGAVYGFGKGFAYHAEQEVDAALDWLEHNQEEPFFLFLHTFLQNGYYGVWERKRYVAYAHLSQTGQPQHDLHLLNRDLYDVRVPIVDRKLGSFFEFLRNSGLEASSIVVLLSDHGESLCQDHDNGRFHAYYHYLPPYEEQLRVPLIFRLPELFPLKAERPAALRVRDPVSLIDVAPTLLDLCGIPVPDPFQGRSLRAAMESRPLEERPHFSIGRKGYVQRGTPRLRTVRCRAVTFRGRKYIHYPQDPKADELYDLRNDPLERINLIVSGGKDEAKGLKRMLIDAGIRRGWDREKYRKKDRTKVKYEMLNVLRSLGYLQ